MANSIEYSITGRFCCFNKIGHLLGHKEHIDSLLKEAMTEYGLGDFSFLVTEDFYESYLKAAIPELSDIPTFVCISVNRPKKKELTLVSDELEKSTLTVNELLPYVEYMNSTISMDFDFNKAPTEFLTEFEGLDMDQLANIVHRDNWQAEIPQ